MYITEPETLVLDALNPVHFISISTAGTLIFCLILSFGYPCWVPTNQSSLIDRLQSFPASDWLFGFCERHIGWLNFRHFPGYKIRIKLIFKSRNKIDLDIHKTWVSSSGLEKEPPIWMTLTLFKDLTREIEWPRRSKRSISMWTAGV